MLKYIQEINLVEHEPGLWNNWLTEIGCPVEVNNDEHIDIEAVSYTHLTLPTIA